MKDLFQDSSDFVMDYHYSTGLLHMIKDDLLYVRNPDTKRLEKNILPNKDYSFKGVTQSVYHNDLIYVIGEGDSYSNRIF
jgi:hypothetical protein